MTRLSELATVIPGARVIGGDADVRGLAYDSRQVQSGDLFFCVRGLKMDGHRFLPDVQAKGAAAAVVDTEDLPVEIPAILVPNVREAMPQLAAAFYGYPSRRLQLIGVTGTNGKTTTTYLATALAKAAGKGTGVIGTIGSRINDDEVPGERTTPESPDLQALLRRMADAETGSRMVVAMEVSSHALDLGRTLGCEFDVGVFTNLTQDHLDYHKGMEDYFLAKSLLFTDYPRRSEKPFTGVINVDDGYGRRLVEMTAGRVMTYGVESADAELRASSIQASPKGLRFEMRTPEGTCAVSLRLGGLFNVYNSLAAMGAARAAGIPWDVILPAISQAPGVPGRFESVDEGQEFAVVVDYAHSPDGVENVLKAGRALNPRRIITVFGCGGDRDRTKRPIMARIAAELSDRVIVTSDNPRTEDPEAIIAEILTGVPTDRASAVETEPDRKAAIERAIRMAEKDDLVVIAGKGHENYQIFKTGTIHFDDREEARNALHSRLSG